ncbi:hypothetical protein QBC39DRAFT_264192 [Podospora conica]|nr:hypothetical protein QBC39DRAFT_264192 [Schizothecium conicum]
MERAESSYFAPGATVEHAAAPTTAGTTPLNEAPPTPTTEHPPSSSRPLPATAARNVQFRSLDRQQSAIRLRRLRTRPPSLSSIKEKPAQPSSQQPGLTQDNPLPVVVQPLSSVPENGSQQPAQQEQVAVVPVDPHHGGLHRFLGRRRHPAQTANTAEGEDSDDCYDSRIVDILDVIDPEVATLSSITNVQNSLFVPSLGRWVNRRPTYDLSHLPKIPGAFPESLEDLTKHGAGTDGDGARAKRRRGPSLSSVLSDTQYAILPDDATLEGWTDDEIKMLNDHVRHMLHSRRSKFKQRLKAFGKYTRRPLGFFVTLYATLITLFGLAWVLFLIGWIYVGEKQLYVINVIDYVLVALFAVVGDGMIPWRLVDTYRMAHIAHLHRKTWKLRKKLRLPVLNDHNDLPTADTPPDVEAAQVSQKDEFIPVLSDKEQATLLHHQKKLARSHTFYKPHETETHNAFPLRLLIAIVLLLDLHSCLQVTLGAVTFGIPYETRPAAVTTTVLCCSITANALAGILISIGDRRTRKKDVIERLVKQELTAQAMKRVRKEKEKEEKEKEEQKKKEEEGGNDNGLLAPIAPFVERIRNSTDKGSTSSNEKRE